MEVIEVGYQDDTLEDEGIIPENDGSRLTIASPLSCINGLIDEIEAKFGVPRDDALKLLLKFGWNKNKLESNIMSELADFPIEDNVSFSEQEIECIMCHTKEETAHYLSLGCKHCFCKCCFTAFLQDAIKEQDFMKPCPFKGCHEIITSSLIKEYLSESLPHYEALIIDNFLSKCKDIRMLECPRNKCLIIIMNHTKSQIYNCLPDNIKCESCGHSFCTKCFTPSHKMLSCHDHSKWLDLREGKEKSCEDWILKNTKSCPRCKVSIEKIEGPLNKMTCANCETAFCWKCLDDWATHESPDTESVPRCLDELEEPQNDSSDFEILRSENQNLLNLVEEGLQKKSTTKNRVIEESLNTVIDLSRDMAMTYPLGYFSVGTKQEKESLRVICSVICSELKNLNAYITKLLAIPWKYGQPDSQFLCEQDWMCRLQNMVYGVRAASNMLFQYLENKTLKL